MSYADKLLGKGNRQEFGMKRDAWNKVIANLHTRRSPKHLNRIHQSKLAIQTIQMPPEGKENNDENTSQTHMIEQNIQLPLSSTNNKKTILIPKTQFNHAKFDSKTSLQSQLIDSPINVSLL